MIGEAWELHTRLLKNCLHKVLSKVRDKLSDCEFFMTVTLKNAINDRPLTNASNSDLWHSISLNPFLKHRSDSSLILREELRVNQVDNNGRTS